MMRYFTDFRVSKGCLLTSIHVIAIFDMLSECPGKGAWLQKYESSQTHCVLTVNHATERSPGVIDPFRMLSTRIGAHVTIS